VPLVAQIEGACMGAGLELASCCDIRIAGESATFGAPIARLGFPMAPRELQLVTHAAGELTVREMLLEAAVLDASEMKRRGFLNRVVPEGAVAAEAAETAQRVARLAPQAARLNKQALARWRESKWAEARSGIAQGATELIADAYGYAASGEHREGITAFLEKRKPVFLNP
jgi:enoyl-CoA hydratase/carnithine racemase